MKMLFGGVVVCVSRVGQILTHTMVPCRRSMGINLGHNVKISTVNFVETSGVCIKEGLG